MGDIEPFSYGLSSRLSTTTDPSLTPPSWILPMMSSPPSSPPPFPFLPHSHSPWDTQPKPVSPIPWPMPSRRLWLLPSDATPTRLRRRMCSRRILRILRRLLDLVVVEEEAVMPVV